MTKTSLADKGGDGRDKAGTGREELFVLVVASDLKPLVCFFADGSHLGLALLHVAFAFLGHLPVALEVKRLIALVMLRLLGPICASG